MYCIGCMVIFIDTVVVPVVVVVGVLFFVVAGSIFGQHPSRGH